MITRKPLRIADIDLAQDGVRVTIEIKCQDEAEATQLFDLFASQSSIGRIELRFPPRKITDILTTVPLS